MSLIKNCEDQQPFKEERQPGASTFYDDDKQNSLLAPFVPAQSNSDPFPFPEEQSKSDDESSSHRESLSEKSLRGKISKSEEIWSEKNSEDSEYEPESSKIERIPSPRKPSGMNNFLQNTRRLILKYFKEMKYNFDSEAHKTFANKKSLNLDDFTEIFNDSAMTQYFQEIFANRVLQRQLQLSGVSRKSWKTYFKAFRGLSIGFKKRNLNHLL